MESLTDRADRRQRLAAKSERGDMRQIVARQFRGRVTFDGEGEFLGRHAAAVVDDLDQRPTAVLQGDVDASRPGIDGIFDKFLDGGSRALDDLAGRRCG